MNYIELVIILIYKKLFDITDMLADIRQKLSDANEDYNKMICTDFMTFGLNRTAFEKKMVEIRNRTSVKGMIILIADINDLKYINDNWGHGKGDEAICAVVKLIKNSFSDSASCYRIGGDEFCIISEELSEKEFQREYEEFCESCKLYSEHTEYPFSVAAAYHVMTAEDDIDTGLKKADKKMYEEKIKMKTGGKSADKV